MINRTMPFTLSKNVFVAKEKTGIVLLDVQEDKYYFLDEQQSLLLDVLLATRSLSKESSNSLSAFKNNLASLNLVTQTKDLSLIESTKRKLKEILSVKEELDWTTLEKSPPFSLSVKAFFILIKMHALLKKYRIRGLLDSLKDTFDYYKPTVHPTKTNLANIAFAIKKASLYQPRRTLCLVWAATFSELAYQNNFRCDLMIGVQQMPFRAHAWVESNNYLMSEDPDISSHQKIIFSLLNHYQELFE